MIIDILIIALFLSLAIIGYLKGFVVGLINLVLGAVYFYFASDILDIGLNTLHDNQLSSDIANSSLMKYFVIVVVGIIVLLIANIIIRKIVRKSFVSGVDRVGGVIIYLLIGYTLLCVITLVYGFISPFFDIPESLQNSFFLSEGFQQYNLIYRWWLGV